MLPIDPSALTHNLNHVTLQRWLPFTEQTFTRGWGGVVIFHLMLGEYFFTNEKIYFIEGRGTRHFAYRRHTDTTTHKDSSPHFYQTEEVFYYTEALVLFPIANVNIFFSPA